MELNVHFAYEPSPEALALLREELPAEISTTFGSDLTSQGQIDILVAGVPSRETLVSNPNLRTLIIPFAGLPRPTRELLAEFPQIAVHNLHHNAIATAETAFALLLASAKNIVPIDRRLRADDWTSRMDGGGERRLSGSTAVILGFGSVGTALARMCHGLEMKVIGVRRSKWRSQTPGLRAADVAELSDVLPEADVLFLTVPMTPETTGLIGAAELRRLPDNAILINVARGPVVDEGALYEELSSGRIRAGIDVWYCYPKGEKSISSTPPSNFPFRDLDNVVMSPHRGGHCEGIELARASALVTLLTAVSTEEIAINRVDLDRGY